MTRACLCHLGYPPMVGEGGVDPPLSALRVLSFNYQT